VIIIFLKILVRKPERQKYLGAACIKWISTGIKYYNFGSMNGIEPRCQFKFMVIRL